MVDQRILNELDTIEGKLTELGVLLDTMKSMSHRRQTSVMDHTADTLFSLAERIELVSRTLKRGESSSL